MKLCFKCHHEKPLTEFYRHPMMGDGHLGKCKDCARADVVANRSVRVDYYREYDRGRASLPHRVAARKQYAATEVGVEGRRWAHSKYERIYPERARAHNAVGNAVRDKKLFKQPCRDCGNGNVHGHHPNYSKPLDVIWLCPEHHRAEHARTRRSA